jgi:hypothetical protein
LAQEHSATLFRIERNVVVTFNSRRTDDTSSDGSCQPQGWERNILLIYGVVSIFIVIIARLFLTGQVDAEATAAARMVVHTPRHGGVPHQASVFGICAGTARLVRFDNHVVIEMDQSWMTITVFIQSTLK